MEIDQLRFSVSVSVKIETKTKAKGTQIHARKKTRVHHIGTRSCFSQATTGTLVALIINIAPILSRVLIELCFVIEENIIKVNT